MRKDINCIKGKEEVIWIIFNLNTGKKMLLNLTVSKITEEYFQQKTPLLGLAVTRHRVNCGP